MWNKIKKIYVGTQQVRPKDVFEYSYDFRNKTISQIISDWWTTAQWTPTITSNWYSSSNSSRSRSNFTLPSLSNAKKITLKTTIVFNNSTSAWKAVRLFTSSRTNATGYLVSAYWDMQVQIGWDSTILSPTWSAWTYNTTAILDLQNATYTFSVTWFSDNTWTITSTQISNIRACTVAEVFSEDNKWALSSISLTVEY